jgi:hypothetical protein
MELPQNTAVSTKRWKRQTFTTSPCQGGEKDALVVVTLLAGSSLEGTG